MPWPIWRSSVRVRVAVQTAEFKGMYEVERDRRVKAEQDIQEVRRDARTEILLFGAQNTAAKQ